MNRRTAAAGAAALLTPAPLWAHSFGQIYTLPVPYWMYIYGAAAALMVSFLIVAWFATARDAGQAPAAIAFGDSAAARRLRQWHLPALLQALALLALLLSIVTGLFGSRDPYRNINMTLVWVVFALGLAYASAVAGDIYALVNPWRSLARGLERLRPGFCHGRIAYPARLGYWPAVALYMGFIWTELFAHVRPFSLAVGLIAYTAITLFGVWLFGLRAWLRQGELFSVFFRLVALMAPVRYDPAAGERERLQWRVPFSGLLTERCDSLGLLVFVLFMLSSTAFDGLRETMAWFSLVWKDPFNILTPLLGTPPIKAYVWLRPYYVAFESAVLVASPFLYLAAFVLFVWIGKILTRSPLSTYRLTLEFALSLLPIALVYNVTHYYTLLLNQGVKIASLASDPFGWGWDLFGTARRLRAPILPDMVFIWHSQVALILLGHIVSVIVAHRIALRLFPNRRSATLSQLPMLMLMVLFTGAGLWILAQPLQGGR